MFGIKYLKAGPTQHVIHYVNGKVTKSGTGLAFFYFQPTSSISVVPVASVDVPFIFNELSADFQPLTVQGQLTYQITQPELVATLLDYSVLDAPGNYLSDDPEKLSQRVVNIAQVETRGEVQGRAMREAIRASDEIAAVVLGKLAQNTSLQALGVKVLTYSVLAIRPVPETARALEAEAREALLRQADEAIYDRRNSAVEQERRIKENELNTEIAVETKKRQIRETKVEADMAIEAKNQQIREMKLAGDVRLEEERKQLVAARVENDRAEADVQAYAVEASLKPLTQLDAAVLQMLTMQTSEPRLMVANALSEIARNAGKIGQLNISPELLATLMQARD